MFEYLSLYYTRWSLQENQKSQTIDNKYECTRVPLGARVLLEDSSARDQVEMYTYVMQPIDCTYSQNKVHCIHFITELR
jgi:hypothetical protein